MPYLEGPPDCLMATRPGAIVNRTLFGIVEGTGLGREFASYFGVADVHDPNQHKIVNENIDVEAIKTFVSVYREYEDEAEALFGLMKHGFEFHLSPNG